VQEEGPRKIVQCFGSNHPLPVTDSADTTGLLTSPPAPAPPIKMDTGQQSRSHFCVPFLPKRRSSSVPQTARSAFRVTLPPGPSSLHESNARTGRSMISVQFRRYDLAYDVLFLLAA